MGNENEEIQVEYRSDKEEEEDTIDPTLPIEEEEEEDIKTPEEADNENQQKQKIPLVLTSNTNHQSRRGISGYLLFMKNSRELIQQELIKEGKKCSVSEIGKKAGNIWNNLSKEEKQKWNEQAKTYQPPTQINKPDNKKKKKASGYMQFLKIKREEIINDLKMENKKGIKEIGKRAGEIWKNMTEDEKKQWSIQAEEAAALVVVTEEDEGQKIEIKQDQKLLLPFTKIREICKMDPEVKNVNPLAIRLLTQATEVFTNLLIRESFDCSDKKKVKLMDVHHIVHSNDDIFGFLVPDFEAPAQIAYREMKNGNNNKKIKLENVDITSDNSSSNKITSYFSKV